jgi:hypothetical protein
MIAIYSLKKTKKIYEKKNSQHHHSIEQLYQVLHRACH